MQIIYADDVFLVGDFDLGFDRDLLVVLTTFLVKALVAADFLAVFVATDVLAVDLIVVFLRSLFALSFSASLAASPILNETLAPLPLVCFNFTVSSP